jgi:hypothetical protein
MRHVSKTAGAAGYRSANRKKEPNMTFRMQKVVLGVWLLLAMLAATSLGTMAADLILTH